VLQRLAKVEPWDVVLEAEPTPHRVLVADELDEALLVVADFVDVKSPYAVGHSRRCADLVADAARVLGLDEAIVDDARRAALVHELGMTAISNAILDKPSSLTRAERDRVEIHTMLTEQMLRRSSGLQPLNAVAAAHHERADGNGYHKGLKASAVSPAAAVLEAAEVYVGITTDRADRPGSSPESAAAELRRLVAEGVLGHEAAEAVLAAAGHRARRAARAQNPAGLSDREIEVAAPGGPRPHRQGDRRVAVPLAEDCRPPHPARLRQDRRLHPCRSHPVGRPERGCGLRPPARQGFPRNG